MREAYIVRGDDMERMEDVTQVDPFEARLVALMNRYEKPLYGYVLQMLRNREEAMDCTQDTFVRAYEHLRDGRSINGTWLFTVARNRAVDEIRRNKFVQSGDKPLERIGVSGESLDHALDVQRIMSEMCPLDREVLHLFAVEGFKTDEIGKILGVRGTAVRQRLSRARERFRRLEGAHSTRSRCSTAQFSTAQ